MVPSAKPKPLIDETSLPAANHYYLAFSGGLDSTVLLHHLTQQHALQGKLSAIHINHQLHPEADQWAHHCAQICEALEIPLITATVSAANDSENAARTARYAAFAEILTAQDCLVTAHHLNDQLETVLFRLLRGTGLYGLTAMQTVSRMDHYAVYRPLLNTSQEQLNRYAHSQQLKWVSDPSNDDHRYSRNHLRHRVLPALLDYHPDSLNNLAQTRLNLQHSLDLLTTLLGNDNPLPIAPFTQPALLASALYHWLHGMQLAAPQHGQLRQFSEDCLQAAPDAKPELAGPDYQLVLWQQQVHALRPLETNSAAQWQPTLQAGSAWTVPSGQGRLLLQAEQGVQLEVDIRFQQRGERLLLPGHKHHKKLKKLFQEHAVPPWIRSVMPMLYINGELMACGDQFLSQRFVDWLSAHQAQYHWRSPHFLM
ncbi:tRNA lysidine(34) synthetase TilS [Marinicella meishanensis]|uniref:tRNA lysidine(34) synthetase TilS n=1 Tax=Marinicella meishanensis TaxID=2873263 RepID=UPI001CBCF157|nr:tRNA lysidine(34) synthetase TilS [Marinicella sp. NBU2979]